MEIKYLSASRMDTWVTCKYKYGCRYHKFHPEVVIDQAVHFKLGTAVHKALEFAGGLVKDKGLTSFSDDDIGAICLEYYKQAIKESLDDAVIREDGLNMLRNKLDNFEFHMPILTLEKWFEVKIEGVPVKGAMDRVVEVGNSHIGVVDYKTSKNPKTEAELLNDIQAGVYDIVARQLFPFADEVTVCMDFLRHAPVTVTIPPEKREANKLFVKSVYQDILDASEYDLKPSKHMFCPWCEYVDVCPEIQSLKKKVDEFDVSLTSDIDELAEVYYDAGLLFSQYRLKKEVIGAKLKKALDAKQTSHLTTDKFNISVRSNAYKSYNVSDAYNILGSDKLLKCVKLNNTLFEREAKKAGLSDEDINALREVNFSKPIINIKPIKK